MKKVLKMFLVALLAVGVFYFAGVGYYSEKFAANTEYGSIKIGNLTLEEAQQKIEQDIADTVVTLTEGGQEVGQVKLAEIEATYNTMPGLQALYQSQDPQVWVTAFASEDKVDEPLAEQVDLNADQLAANIADQGIDNTGREAAVDAKVEYSEDQGYHVVEGTNGNQIDPELLSDAIINSIEAGSGSVALEDAYDQPDITSESPEVTEAMALINELINTQVTLDMGEVQETIPADKIEEWLYFDDNNQPQFDQEGIREYVLALDEEHSSYNKYRQFESTNQGTVEVQPGILGWGIEIEEEVANISNDLRAGNNITRSVATHSSGGEAGKSDDIGDTYVEIDLTYQAMYLYVDGKLIVETPIVSGQPGAETVPGANAVNEMLVDTNLVGFNQFYNVNYSTPVSYWIRFDDQAQGIHDAPWQGSYGGDVWTYAGSLGCINTPYDAVATIYEHVEIGTPVIVFY